jgi:hypothetical protein
MIAAWVTMGNGPSEALLSGSGWTPVTPPLDRATGLGLYRAAEVAESLAVDGAVAVAVEAVDDQSARLWVISKEAHAPTTSALRGVAVSVRWESPTSPVVQEIANSSAPIAGAAWLLAHR